MILELNNFVRLSTYLSFYFLLAANILDGEERVYTESVEEELLSKGAPGTGLALWFGLDVGTNFVQTKYDSKELSKFGPTVGGKAYFSLFSNTTILDLGGGWYWSRSEPIGQSEEIEEGVNLTASFAVIEAAARYRMGKFSIGPQALVSLGTDSSFSPVKGEDDPNVFAGIRMGYGDADESGGHSQWGLFGLIDVTINERDVIFLGLQYLIGVPLRNPDVIVRNEVQVKEKTRYRMQYLEKNVDRYIIDAGFINLETNKAEVNSRDRDYLQDLASFLGKNSNFWDLVVIRSHTDERGSDELNSKLTAARAGVVMDIFNESVDEGKISIKTLKSEYPVDSQKSDLGYARNRRVEIEVVGKRKVLRLKAAIARIKQKHRKPDTCADSSCK